MPVAAQAQTLLVPTVPAWHGLASGGLNVLLVVLFLVHLDDHASFVRVLHDFLHCKGMDSLWTNVPIPYISCIGYFPMDADLYSLNSALQLVAFPSDYLHFRNW